MNPKVVICYKYKYKNCESLQLWLKFKNILNLSEFTGYKLAEYNVPDKNCIFF